MKPYTHTIGKRFFKNMLFLYFKDTLPPIPATSNHELQEDLQRLRSCLESQLTLMQNSLGIHKGNNDTEKHHHGKSQYFVIQKC